MSLGATRFTRDRVASIAGSSAMNARTGGGACVADLCCPTDNLTPLEAGFVAGLVEPEIVGLIGVGWPTG